MVSVEISVGQQISQGQNLIMLEAMKMNTYVTAARAGTVRAIHVAAGASVAVIAGPGPSRPPPARERPRAAGRRC